MIEDIDIEIEFATHGTYGYMCIYDTELRTFKWSRRRDLEPHERFMNIDGYKQMLAERERKS